MRTPESPPEPAWQGVLHPGLVVGRFELVRELGRGGFGVVYEARDRELGRAVAFKAICTSGSPEVREGRLLQEAEAAARLSHPNIVTLHDVGRTEHGPYLILELLHGRSLAARLAHGRLSVGEAVRVGVEAAKGLAHAHARGVVHRDLTPGNVYLCDDGQVKLLDLGMAHAFGCRKLEGGTPAYMAPEQGRGAPEDERTDVFALGAVLYRMLAGELPYGEGGAGASHGPRAAPALEVPELPALGELVGRMLERDPVERPRDAAEVLTALGLFQAELARAPTSGATLPVRRRRRAPSRRALLAAAGLLLAAGLVASAALVAHRRPAATGRSAAPSIAVLPFVDLSPHRDQEYFSDGLSEEILNALAHVDGLHVAGRSSAFAFKGRDGDLRVIGQKLNVGTVLEGSVRKAGDRVRITAQIIDVSNGYHLWSETFDRDLADVFAVQDDIARAVVRALEVKLLPGRAPPARALHATSPAVYEQYLLARQSYAQFTQEGFRRAAAAYQKAIALDPGYAPAWSGLAIQLSNTMERASTPAEVADLGRRSLAAAERAIALDPELAEGYAARSLLRALVQWDWRGAQADMDRALSLAAGDAATQRRSAILLAALGRNGDAIAAARKAVEIDPLFAANWIALGGYYLNDHQLVEARGAYERAREMAPQIADVDFNLGIVSLLEGHPAAALPIFERLPDELSRLTGVTLAQHALGHPAEAQRALDALIARHGERHPVTIGSLYSYWGEVDRAFEWLDRAYAQHDPELVGLQEHVAFAPAVRADPRFAALLRRMNLPVE
ncbi:hypothetical protein AMYX_02070 [Anaeromyxobacter diazotrophicus]|uniref:Protein kinase domain-containing protein n=1 Tax=Anaeromyxobacter diazotrophicus TaxID=2590199 RepID=A0A7I9VGE5_9BACT|nr:hypothetical protein AMYX_02070 [Anaeromyxobacter diazotrophicus]